MNLQWNAPGLSVPLSESNLFGRLWDQISMEIQIWFLRGTCKTHVSDRSMCPKYDFSILPATRGRDIPVLIQAQVLSRHLRATKAFWWKVYMARLLEWRSANPKFPRLRKVFPPWEEKIFIIICFPLLFILSSKLCILWRGCPEWYTWQILNKKPNTDTKIKNM